MSTKETMAEKIDDALPTAQDQDHHNEIKETKETLQPAEPKKIAPEHLSSLKLTILVLALFLAIFLTALDRTIVSTAIPRITDQFKSVDDVGWYGSAYFMTSTALQPAYGRIYKSLDVRFRLQ